MSKTSRRAARPLRLRGALPAEKVYTTHESFAHQQDLRDWQPGSPAEPRLLYQLPKQARGLNGCCLLAPGVVLVADCFAGLIWRMDLAADEGEPTMRVWLDHESMGYFPGKMKPEQPGVNGVRYAAKSNFLYYTATAKKLLMRVKVCPHSLYPAARLSWCQPVRWAMTSASMRMRPWCTSAHIVRTQSMCLWSPG